MRCSDRIDAAEQEAIGESVRRLGVPQPPQKLLEQREASHRLRRARRTTVRSFGHAAEPKQ
jgi:hypothetical protein